MKYLNAILSLLLCTTALSSLAPEAKAIIGPSSNHPERQWRTLDTEHFQIHFYQGYEQFSQLVARVAEDGFDKITGDLGMRPKAKIPLIITEDEFWNGFAEPARNRIVLDPRFSLVSTIGLNRFILHEMTHILNFEANTGFHAISKLDKAARMPSWFAEGLAQYEAEYWTAENDRMLRLNLLNNQMLTPSERTVFTRLSGKGSAGYNEGYSLVSYMFTTYGHDKLATLLYHYRNQTGHFYDAIYNTFGKTYLELDAEWRQSLEQHYQNQIQNRTESVPQAEDVLPYQAGRTFFQPVYSPQSKWATYMYSSGYPLIRGHIFNIMSLRAVPSKVLEDTAKQLKAEAQKREAENKKDTPNQEVLKASQEQSKKLWKQLKDKEKKLVKRGVMDFEWHPSAPQIAYTHLHPHAQGSTTTGISLLKVKEVKGTLEPDGDPQLLTPAYAAHSVTWSPDGTQLAFVKEDKERDSIVLYHLKTQQTQVLLSAPDFRQYQALRWSPDGSQIVFESYLPGEGSQLLLLSPQDKTLKQITETDSMHGDRQPNWSPDSQSLYFISNREGFADLYQYELGSQTIKRMSQVYTGLETPQFKNKETLFFVRHHADGTSWESVKASELQPKTEQKSEVSLSLFEKELGLTPLPKLTLPPQKYLPWMAPEVVVPIFGRDEQGDQLGVLAQFSDLLQQHSFNVLALYGIASQRIGYSAAYINRFFDTNFAVEVADSPILSFTTDGSFFFIQRDQHLSLMLSRPLFNPGTGDTFATRIRRFASLEYSLAYQTNLREELDAALEDKRQLRNGFNSSLSLSFSGDETRGNEGMRYSLSVSGGHPFLGGDFQHIEGSADFRHYIPVFDTHQIAYRVGAAALAGETRPILMGGPPLNNLLVLNFQNIFPLRGFQLAELQGEYLLGGSLEYRFPLVSGLNYNWGLNYLKDLTGAVFIDAGDTWFASKRAPVPHISTGLELRAQTLLNGRNSFQLYFGAGKSLLGHEITPSTRGIEFYGGFANVF